MGYFSRKVVRREAILLFLCACSDLLPRTLLAEFIASHGAMWGAIVDNMSHAGIAAASWAVLVAISSPPSLATAAFQSIALPGSPLYRCISCALLSPTTTPQESDNMMPAEDSCKDLGTTAPCQRSTRPSQTAVAATAAVAEEAAGKGGGMARRAVVAEVLLAACFGSLLDLDHFLAAGSLRLSRATGLAGRPWGHSVAALVVAALATAALTHNARAAASVLSAGLSHQLRDATRRGLWLYPPGGPETPPLGYPVYLLAQALLPLLGALCLVLLRRRGGSLSGGGGGRCCRVRRGSIPRRRWRRGPCARSSCRGDEGEGRGSRALLPL